MNALYWCLGVGCVVLAVVKLWPSEDEDADRALRIQREYFVPVETVSEPTGRRTPRREHPEIPSRYKEEPDRGRTT